ncbi:hypothetical protein GMORB2_0744 [Geosmithia morbida]|uniref:non-specific serine/threonine protein kinase n=1 Tax=Geosmithia morbida TaxID=1094350 RepID=A0A9P5D7V1_9HYPO|nr:uncharacterized protein GMORB2_0744 [Geosmithia morbida]KAF4127006.1 hypothetical protein GMORB2_0744 [Geosmithia morbida]
MLQRPQGRGTGRGGRGGRGQGTSNRKKLALAVALLLIPWAQVASADSGSVRQQPDSVRTAANELHHHHAVDTPRYDDASVPAIEVAPDSPDDDDHEGRTRWPPSHYPKQHQQHAPPQDHHRGPHTIDKNLLSDNSHHHTTTNINHNNNNNNNNINNININRKTIPNDASALATLAPAQPVRAPHPQKRQWPKSVSTSGLASSQVERNLEDWEVEDFVLLATIDGDLYASNRRTGKELWHLEVDQPMIETRHHRANSSILDDDYEAIDHYIWAVEPVRDGAIYVWIPDSGIGLARTGFTMKRIVEDLAPFADEDPPVVYTGDKKTTLITLDAATGRVLKWFGSGGSHINQEESCLRPSALYNMDAPTECSSTGTITLGRTEYTVGIQRRDGRPIATLKFAEWVPNNYDNDLQQQYHTTLDSRYITSQHDGKVYAFDYNEARKASPRFRQTFSAPVARVFDVCRPWDAPSDSNPELVLLPQPPMPTHDEDVARMRSNSIFLNCTASGSWYAMSGRSYPLIIDAPTAQACLPDWPESAYSREYVGWGSLRKSLVGTHLLDSPMLNGARRQRTGVPTIDDGTAGDVQDDHPYLPIIAPEDELGGIVEKVKSLPQSAANSILDFISNPTLIIVFIVMLVVNENKLRRSYQRFRAKDFMEKFLIHPLKDEAPPKKSDELDDKGNTTPGYTAGHNDEAKAKKKETALDDLEERGQEKEQVVLPPKTAPPQPETDRETSVDVDPNAISPEKKKKAHRGRRGGVKHRKGGKMRDPNSTSQGDETTAKPVDDAVTNVMRYGGEPTTKRPGMEPNIMTVQPSDMQAVGGPIVRMGNIEVDTDVQLGSGSNGTLVFAGKFDGREVAVKRMLIHFYDIASQETKLLRESDDHPNVIRYYSQQAQDGFLYIALERCAASLAEEQRDPPSAALCCLEDKSRKIIPGGDFLKSLPREFVDSLGKQRKYTGNRTLDLLRALRNKRNHYEDMTDSLKRTVGALPEGYLAFWTFRFPELLLECWNVVWDVGWDTSDRFKEYYSPAGL